MDDFNEQPGDAGFFISHTENRTLDTIHGMNNEKTDAVIIRVSRSIKILALCITLAVLATCIPPAVQFIPREAFGYIVALILTSVASVYIFMVIFSYRLLLREDGITAEALPNPFLRSFHCRYDEISGIEQETGWSTLLVYRFRNAEPYRLTNLELLEAGPIRLLEEINARFPEGAFIVRATDSLRRWWKWHRLLIHILLSFGAGWFSLRLLSAAGMLSFLQISWDSVLIVFLICAFSAGFLDLAVLRLMNRDA
jgi:hypothetical protein